MSQRLSCSGEGGRSSGLERSGLALLRFLRRKPAPPPGTLRWAQFLPDEKLGKESLRAFPPKDLPGVRGCPCVKSRFGPSPLLWPLFVPPHQATLGSWPYGWVVSTSGPTLEERRSRRRKHGRTPCYAVVGAGLARPAATPALPWKIREGQAPPLRPKIKIRAVGTPQLFIIHLSFFISLANPLRCGILKKLYSLRRWALARRQRSPSILC